MEILGLMLVEECDFGNALGLNFGGIRRRYCEQINKRVSAEEFVRRLRGLANDIEQGERLLDPKPLSKSDYELARATAERLPSLSEAELRRRIEVVASGWYAGDPREPNQVAMNFFRPVLEAARYLRLSELHTMMLLASMIEINAQELFGRLLHQAACKPVVVAMVAEKADQDRDQTQGN